MKKALALIFAFTCSMAGAAAAQDKAPATPAPKVGEAKGTVRWVEIVEPGAHAIVLEDGTRLSVSDKQINDIWAGDQVKAGFVVTPDGGLAVTGVQVDRFSNQEAD